MPSDPEAKQVIKRRSVRKRRMWVLVFLLCALVGTVLAYRHFTAGERIRGMAQEYLQRYAQGLVSIGGAKMSWLGGVHLFDVTITETGSESPSESGKTAVNRSYPVFSCREITLAHDFTSAIFGKLRILSIVAAEPTCAIVRNVADGRVSFAGLERLPAVTEGEAPPDLPRIELRDAHIQFVSQEESQVRVVEDVELTLRGLPSKQGPAVYDVVWYRKGGRLTGSGQLQVDLRTARISDSGNGLPPISIQAMILTLSGRYPAADNWGDILGLDGIVRAMDYDLSAAGLKSGDVVLTKASISIPVSEEELHTPRDSRYLRIEPAEGHVHLTSRGASAKLTGEFHGSECTVDATFHGELEKMAAFEDMDFDARVVIKNLILPRPDSDGVSPETRFINHWPELAELYAEFDPRGPVDVDVEVTKRSGADEHVVIRRATLTAKGAEVKCPKLPRRLRNVTGTIAYTPEAVVVRDLRGDHGDGTVISVNGRLAASAQPTGNEITIRGTTIPIDDALWNALPARYGTLREEFDPNGTVDCELTLIQSSNNGTQTNPWQWSAAVTFTALSAQYAGFPYQLTDLRGAVVLDAQSLRIVDIVGRAGQAPVSIAGTVALGGDEVENLELTVNGENVSLDQQILSALPNTVQSWIQPFHPQGRFNVRTALKLDPTTKRIVHTSTVTLNDCSIRHDKLPAEVNGILGRVHIRPGQVVFEGLTGLYNGAVVSAEGTVNVAGARPAVQLVIRTRGLQLDDRFVTALPEEVRQALNGWRLDGLVDTQTLLTTTPAGQSSSVVARTLVQVRDATVSHPFFPVPFRNVRGQISIDATDVRAEKIEAQYGGAAVHADVRAHFKEGKEHGSITLTATDLALGDTVRGCLRGGFAATWDRLKPSGSVDLRLDSLGYERSGPDTQTEWSAGGRVELKNVALAGLANIEGLSGTLAGQGSFIDRAGGTSLNGDLAFSALTVLGLHLSQTNAAWSFARTSDGQGAIALDSFRGLIYDGDLNGEVKLLFDAERADYELSANVRDMRIGPFLNATRATRPVSGEAREVEGLADAHLYLSGPVGDPSSRRGGGRFEFSEARIQRLPFTLAILAVLNLSMPDQDAFDTVGAQFLVAGNRVHVNDFQLRGTGLALSGSGLVSLPDWGVDVNLINVSPHRWARVPVLADLIEGAAGELVELRVTGPLSQPTVRAVPFHAVRDELNQLFKKRKPKPIQPATP